MKPITIKYIFFGIILFVIIGIVYTNVAGKKQDEIYKQDFLQYQQAMQYMNNNKLDNAIATLEGLLKKYPDEYYLYYQLGLAYNNQENYKKASIYFQKAVDIRPAILENPMFAYKMGESLYNIQQFELAKAYLSFPVPTEFEKQKEELLRLIEQETQS